MHNAFLIMKIGVDVPDPHFEGGNPALERKPARVSPTLQIRTWNVNLVNVVCRCHTLLTLGFVLPFSWKGIVVDPFILA